MQSARAAADSIECHLDDGSGRRQLQYLYALTNSDLQPEPQISACQAGITSTSESVKTTSHWIEEINAMVAIIVQPPATTAASPWSRSVLSCVW